MQIYEFQKEEVQSLFKEKLKTLPNTRKDTNIFTHQSERALGKISPEKKTPRHIIIRLLK